MIRTIHLHGRLKKEFGPKHRFDVRTAAEALRALNCAYPGQFIKALQSGSFRIVRGDRHNGMQLDLKLINGLGLGMADLHIIPVATGAANGKGVAKTVLGVALIGSAIFFSGGTMAAPLSGMSGAVIQGMGITWGNIALVGLGLTLAGAATLLARTTSAQDAKDDSSFNISGPSNSGNQGDAIQVGYGRYMVKSVNVSYDNTIEDIGAYQGVDAPGPAQWIGGFYNR